MKNPPGRIVAGVFYMMAPSMNVANGWPVARCNSVLFYSSQLLPGALQLCLAILNFVGYDGYYQAFKNSICAV